MIPHNRPTINEDDIAAVSRTLRTAWIAQGPEVRAFEEELAARCGLDGADAVAVSSGTAALFLALASLGIGVGDRVLIPTYVCTALVHAIRLTGAEAQLSDIRDSDFNLDPTDALDVQAAILPYTYGVPRDADALRALGIPVIEDAAQAIGACWNGHEVGRFGTVSIFSFYATKPLTAGQGGMIVGPPDICREIRDRRDYDGKPVLRTRFNFQMTDIQAALGRSQLRRFDEFLARRRNIAALYSKALPERVGRQQTPAGGQSNNFRFVIRLERVADAQRRFKHAGIATIVPTEPYELLHRQLGLAGDAFLRAERVAGTTLSLPIYPSLSDAECHRIADVLASLGDLV